MDWIKQKKFIAFQKSVNYFSVVLSSRTLSVITGNVEIDFSPCALILFLLPVTEEGEIDLSAGAFFIYGLPLQKL